MLIPVLTIMIGLYGSFLLTRRSKTAFGEATTTKIRLVHLVLLIALILLTVMSSYNIYLRGYWTTKIIIWLFIFSAIALFAFGYKPSLKKAERIYYGAFFYFPLACIPLWVIPLLGIGVVLSIYGHTIGERSDIVYSDPQYRLQYTYTGFLAPASPPDLFVKYGWLEYKEEPLDMEYLGEPDSIKIENTGKKTIRITFYHNGDFPEAENPFTLEVELKK